jgi:hypothetical protein
MVLRSRWNVLPVGCFRVPRLGVTNPAGIITVVPRGPVGQPLRTVKPPAPGVNYTSCLTRQGGQFTNVENLTGYSESQSFNSLTNQSTLSAGRAHVWWYCGGPLLETLPGNRAGTCALVQLEIPFIIAFRSPAHATPPRKRRDISRDVAASRRGTLEPNVYIDAIGAPRGCQVTLKPEIKLQQDLNHYSFGGSQQIKMLIGLIIFTITSEGLLTIPGTLSKE